MLTQTALQGMKKYTQRVISHAKYKICSTYYDAQIDRIDTTSSSTVMTAYLVLNPPLNTNKAVITEVQLYDTGNNLFLSKAENLEINPLLEGALYLLTFEFDETEAG